MTTVVYRDGVLASDGQSIMSSTITHERVPKVFKKKGKLYGCVGILSECTCFLDALTKGNKNLPSLTDSMIVEVSGGDKLKIYDQYGDFEWTAEYMAWGSGIDIAYGALLLGASAEEAVRAACQMDIYSGGSIFSVSLKKGGK